MRGSSSTEDPAARARLARALFRPSRIALLGVSDDPARLTSRPQRLLRRHGFAGAAVPIHPVHAQIGGERAYRSIADVPGRVDHAVIMLPASAVERAVDECGRAGVGIATIFSSGFAETGADGRRRQDTIVASARESRMRVVGPNCLGIVDVPGRIVISANAVFEHEPLRSGGLSLVTQSGSMLGAILTRAQQRGFGFSKLVSVGNECDVAIGELVHLLVDDPDTQAILLFLESFRDAEVLAAAARRAFDAGKPVIAFKPGRSATGRQAAASHTGTLVHDDRVAEAFFRAHGILRVDVFEALFEIVPLVRGHRPPRGRRVGALTVSGGAAAMVADRLGLAQAQLVALPPASRARLAAKRIRVPDAPIVDLPMGRADNGAYGAILGELLISDHCDVALAVLGSNATYDAESTRERIAVATRPTKPLAVFAAPRADEALRLLQQRGVAAFRTPEACADGIRAFLDWRAPALPVRVSDEEMRALRALARGAGHGMLDEHRAALMLAQAGIAFAPARVVHAAGEPVDIPFPVAAKILSADIAHKAAAGGVVLEIANAEALAHAIDAILATVRATRPEAGIAGVRVQTMQRGVAELLAGLVREPRIGALILVGPGGWAAERHGRCSLRLAPVSAETALAMIDEVWEFLPGTVPRASVAAGLAAAARAIHRLSLLAWAPEVLEAEINPLIVSADAAVGVDALVTLAP